MKNSIDAHIEFSFKGEDYAPFATIDLDTGFDVPTSLHAILAQKNGIDTYSYLYEVMQQEEIRFDNAQGLAADFLTDGQFDLEAFVARRLELKTFDLLQLIASRVLGIDDLGQHPELKNALSQAYELGRQIPLQTD